MINPDDRVPQDDSYDDDAEDQQSQKDIHSNGFDETDEPDIDTTDADLLKQAYAAAESSFTLDEDDDDLDED